MKKPRVIMHVDGDAFFASVEQAKDWRLKGKAVVTGGERHIAAAFSYEAKRRGVTRGMNMREVRAVCPEAIIVESDYETYCIFARRMYNIVRRFTPYVEEYSIDECFADITGLDAEYGLSYEDVAWKIKNELEMRLGITFGVGVASTKVLAKIASKFRKPAGLTYITSESRVEFLRTLPIEKVWGIGPSASTYLRRKGCVYVLDFANKGREWLEENNVSKPYREIWYELNGQSVKDLNNEYVDTKSVMRTRTFTPATSDYSYILAELSHNIEEACLRLRHHDLECRAISFFLKTQEFRYHSLEVNLTTSTSLAHDILKTVNEHIGKVYRKGILYRASGITLRSLVPSSATSADLFGERARTISEQPIYDAMDRMNKKFGHSSVILGSSLQSVNRRKDPDRKRMDYHHLDIPYLGVTS